MEKFQCCAWAHFWPTYRASYHRQANVALGTINRYRYYSKNIWNFSVLCNRSSNVDAIVPISLSTEIPKHVPLVPPSIDRPVCHTVSLAASSCLSITLHYTLALVNEMISSLSSSQEHKYTQSLGAVERRVVDGVLEWERKLPFMIKLNRTKQLL